jgi:hypothetical protein
MGMPLWLALNPFPSMVTKEPGVPVAWDNETVGVTLKSISLGWPVAPDARMVREPLGAGGMVRSAVQAPCKSDEATTSIKASPAVILILSLGANPEPLTFKAVAGDPLDRSRIIAAPRVMLRVGTLLLEVNEPKARTVCEPAGREGMSSEPRHEPLASADIPVATGVWPNMTVIVFSSAEKPTPLALTEAPGEELRRSRESSGVTVKVF